MKLQTGAYILALACMVGTIGCGAGSAGAAAAKGSASGSGSGTQTAAAPASTDISAPVPATVAAAVGNNTSASSSFAGTTNGNIAPANVSKVSFHDLLAPGATTKIYVHTMLWWGTSGHMNIGYNSADPAEATRQVNDMVSRGIDGLIVDWYGPNNAAENNAAQALSQSAQQHAGFEFAICEDWGALKGAPDVNAKLIADVNYIYSTYTQSPNYMRKNGQPVIFLFGEEQMTINWAQVVASVQGNPIFIWRNNGGFTQPQSSGSFAWVGLTGNAADPGLAYLNSFYQTAVADAPKHPFGSGYKGFNDSIAPWGTHRLINQNCGQTWLATLGAIANNYTGGNQLENLQIPTWNDYEEGTEIETGIDNCVAISASLNGQSLNWSISGGQENTLHHYAVFTSPDGQTLTQLTDAQPGTHSINLSGYSFPAGTTLYVQAVGMPGLTNHISGPVKVN